ncbi:MAG: hypothetical protein ACFB00_02540 [Parvularculaceae bacterium]
MARLLTIGLLLFVAAFGGGSRAAPVSADISFEALPDGDWRVTYDFSGLTSSVDLGPSLDGFRARDWRPTAGSAVSIVASRGRDVLRGPRPFAKAAFVVTPKAIDAARAYDPIAPMGADAALIYTGHFIPWANGRRAPSTLTVRAPPGRFAAAFGEAAPVLRDWSSPLGRPAYIYVGPQPPIASGGVLGAIDPATPDWLAREAEIFAVEAFGALERAFAWALPATPNFFLAFEPGGAPGRAAYAGDALPAQFRMTLTGGAWGAPSDWARDLFRLGVAHEAAHLWQTAARPKVEGVPDWIHEGGANVLAADVMVSLGYWDAAKRAGRIVEARAKCAHALPGRSLDEAAAAGDVDAIYACGEALNAAASARHPDGGAGFWRDFIDRARADRGYDAETFFALASVRGGSDFADAARAFTKTEYKTVRDVLAALEALDGR